MITTLFKKPRRLQAAFTVTELMISLSVLMVVLAGTLAGHLFGMRMFTITKAKLGANQDARRAISQLTDEIRAARWVRIGNGSATSFSEIDEDSPQRGNAIQIYLTPTNTPYIRYYLDSSLQELRRVTDKGGNPLTIAHSISNSVVFASENFNKITLTNNDNNRVIAMTLEFYQIQYPIIRIGPGEYYDYYKLSTRITRRALE